MYYGLITTVAVLAFIVASLFGTLAEVLLSIVVLAVVIKVLYKQP